MERPSLKTYIELFEFLVHLQCHTIKYRPKYSFGVAVAVLVLQLVATPVKRGIASIPTVSPAG